MSSEFNNSPFSSLPSVSFANFDINAFKTAVVTAWQNNWFNLTGQQITLSPADRRYQFLMAVSGYFIAVYSQIDASAKQNLLPFALGGFLDNICAIFGAQRSKRIQGNVASVTLQFTVPVSTTASVIPAGTQVQDTSGTNDVFQLIGSITIPAGQTTGSGVAQCTTDDAAANGIGIGAITYLTNWNASAGFVPTVTNTNQPFGATANEDDADYRDRMFTVTDSYSNAGSYGAYEFFGLQAAPAGSQISVAGPEDGLAPGNVLLTLLLSGGQMPNSSQLTAVSNGVTPLNIRDLCANVTVSAPTGVPISVTATYKIPIANITNATAIEAAVSNAASTWVTDITTTLAPYIDPSALSEMLFDAGAIDVTVSQPSTFTKLQKWQVATTSGLPNVTCLGFI